MAQISGFRAGKLLRVFVVESDRTGLEPTYTAVVEFLRSHGVAGATVFRGLEGYGNRGEARASFFSMGRKLPVVIEAVEDAAVLEPLIAPLQELITQGLVTVEDVLFKTVKNDSSAT